MLLQRVFLPGIFVLLSLSSIGQTLIMNEVSQGVSGNREYVEFIVVDTSVTYSCTSTSPPCIDIRGWIFDDNSGYHGPVGIASGCVRFSNDPLWSCVPLGTIIVIYNDADPNPQMPADDLSMADNNCSIVAPITNPQLFERNATTPGDVACSYPATGWVPGGSWSNTILANSGDCARIVDLSGCEVFSVCWTSANQNNLVYFNSGATSGSSATNTVYYFNQGDPNLSSNWTIGCADVPACGQEDQTPGGPNNAANAAYIAQFNNGCQPITPIVANAIVDADAGCNCEGQATASASGSIAGYTYEWFDASFNSIGQSNATAIGLCAGTYHVIATSSIGCSDTSTVTITASGATSVNINSEVICEGETTTLIATPGASGGTYVWNPGGFTTQTINVSPAVSSSYTVTYTLGGCSADATGSVTVNPVFNEVESIDVCEGTSVTYPDGFSEIITANTTHTSNLLSVDGCDSIVTSNVTMIPAFNVTENFQLCSGSDYTYPDGTVSNNITADETHVSVLSSANGCDSTITTNITITSGYSTVVDIDLCSGEDYTYADGTTSTNILTNETYVSDLMATNGCDSVVTENVIVEPVYNLVENISACENDVITYPDGTLAVITSSTSYTSALTTVSGCDSIIVTNVTMNPSYSQVQNQSVCEGSTITYPDGTSALITASTTHTSSLVASNGCDSTIVTNVTMNPRYNNIESVQLCTGSNYTYPDGTVSNNITVNETHVSVFNTVNGCDSIITTDITVVTGYNVNVDVNLCSGQDYTYADGTTSVNIVTNESYTSTFLTSTGCDSLVTENVLVQPSFNAVENLSVCENELVSYPDGTTEVVTASTSHTSNLVSVSGCDSIIVTNVVVIPAFQISQELVVCENETVLYPDGSSQVIVTSTSHTSALTSSLGCDSVIITNVLMIPNPTASFSASETNLTTLNTLVNFFNNSVNATSFNWQFSDGSASSEFEPTYNFPDSIAGTYATTLIAYNELGCTDTAVVLINIEEELLFYIPNTFTPDGDEFNQTFQAIFSSGYDPFDFNLVIFNRWGEIIWESFNSEIGWDGTYRGLPVQDGTYTWKIEFKTSANDERKMVIGHVNVLR